MTSTPFEKNLIRRFARHYSISQHEAENLLREADWNWAGAFDGLVTMYKCETQECRQPASRL